MIDPTSFKQKKSKFDHRIQRQSKQLSWLLRHGAANEGLPMSEAGWVEKKALLKKVMFSETELLMVINHNCKSRFEVNGQYIRATQGHSLEPMPVTQEALERSWSIYESTGNDSIYHATRFEYLESIQLEGIKRGHRTHVHLAYSAESPVGKRAGVPILLEVSVKRLRESKREVFISPNGVILTRYVPPHCIVRVHDRRAETLK